MAANVARGLVHGAVAPIGASLAVVVPRDSEDGALQDCWIAGEQQRDAGQPSLPAVLRLGRRRRDCRNSIDPEAAGECPVHAEGEVTAGARMRASSSPEREQEQPRWAIGWWGRLPVLPRGRRARDGVVCPEEIVPVVTGLHLLEPVEGLRRIAHASVDGDVDEVGVCDARVPRLECVGD